MIRVALLLATVVLIPLTGAVTSFLGRDAAVQPMGSSSDGPRVASREMALSSWTADPPRAVDGSREDTFHEGGLGASSPPDAERRLHADSDIDAVQRELRSLGAQYMRLGRRTTAAGIEYRFVCGLPVGRQTVYSRAFEGRAEDPLLAMQDVLRQVRARPADAP